MSTAPTLVSNVRDPFERDVLMRLEFLLKVMGAKPGSTTEVWLLGRRRVIQLSDGPPEDYSHW